jgi:protoheme IX farnesyltransferase
MDGQGTAVATGGPTPDGPGPLHPGDARPLDGRRAKLRAYVLVTKPRIIELLLVTTVPTMVVAAGGWPSTWLVVATVVGGTLSAASANTLNNLIDRDVDRLMSRTASRPTVSGAVSPRGALTLGLVLGVAGFAWLWVFVNLVAALLATGAILFYVFVYTLGMKRRTPQAVVIGGIAGCVPVLTGWAAVTGGDLADPRPWLLFAVLLWWQPPHFWALAMRFREDYARADLPMLPVAYGNDEATRQILLHSYLLMAVVVLAAAGAFTGAAFVVPAVALTGWWLVLAHRLRRRRTVTEAQALFKFSTVHLTLVFLAAAVESVL